MKQTIKFSGDSGDGMQLIGTMFSNIIAKQGNTLRTNANYPADMRAPKNSLGGVSTFEITYGENVQGVDYEADILVCMNNAAFTKNEESIGKDSLVIIDETYDSDNTDKYNKWVIPATAQCNAIIEQGFDRKDVLKSRNIYMLACLCYYLGIDENTVDEELAKKFKTAKLILNAYIVQSAYNFCNNLQITQKSTQMQSTIAPGDYVLTNGNTATAWGLMKAAENTNRQMFFAGYPITPATDILVEMENRRDCGAIAVQAEDEIAAVGMCIGASYGGSLSATATSGPGMCLKTEGINLAVMAEIPLVIIDVMRGGPSTGLPTRSEQSDLNIALYGRSGDSPLPVIAATSPADCYLKAYEAAKIALENNTPVILLTDASIANGLELLNVDQFLECIQPTDRYIHGDNTTVLGGSEVDPKTLTITTDRENHEQRTQYRADKVARIEVPDLIIGGNVDSEVIAIAWGSSKSKLADYETNCATACIEYLNPLPRNINAINAYKNKIFLENNNGQLKEYLK